MTQKNPNFAQNPDYQSIYIRAENSKMPDLSASIAHTRQRLLRCLGCQHLAQKTQFPGKLPSFPNSNLTSLPWHTLTAHFADFGPLKISIFDLKLAKIPIFSINNNRKNVRMMQSKVAVGVPEHKHVLCSVTVELIQLGPVNAPYFSTHQRFRHDSLWARAQRRPTNYHGIQRPKQKITFLPQIAPAGLFFRPTDQTIYDSGGHDRPNFTCYHSPTITAVAYTRIAYCALFYHQNQSAGADLR